MDFEDFEHLAESLARFDLADLLAGIGGLALLPENADHFLRLEQLGGVACAYLDGSDPVSNRPRMSAGRWRTVVNGEPIAAQWILSAEDPYEEPFTTVVNFYGGSYVLPPCGFAGTTSAIQRLAHAIFKIQGNLSPEFQAEMFELFSCVLGLSDAVTSRAGLTRLVAPVRGKGNPVVVPSGNAFAILKGAVSLSTSEMEEIWTTWDQTLAPLMVDWKSGEVPDSYHRYCQLIAATPITLISNGVVVVAPTSLMVALRHRVLTAALERGELAELAGLLEAAVVGEVKESLSRFGLRSEISMIGVAPEAEGVVDSLYRFDVDKALHVVVVTDPLTDYDEHSLEGHWSDSDLPDVLDLHMTAFRGFIREQDPNVSGVLQILVMDAFGRSHVTGVKHGDPDPRNRVLPVNAEALAVMAHALDDDLLRLWKYAGADEALHATTHVMAFSPLALFELYLNHEDSFCLSDDEPPNALFFEPDQGLELKLKALLDADRHAAMSWDGRGDVVVERLMSRTRIPIYVTLANGHIAMLLEGGLLRAWVLSNVDSSADRQDIWEFCDLVAYWLWQIDVFGSFAANITIGVRVDPQLGETADDWFRIEQEGIDLEITIGVEEFMLSSQADNKNERALVSALVTALARLEGSAADQGPLIKAICQPKTKKKMVALRVGDSDVELRPGDLEKPRRIQQADVSSRLDEIGAWLARRVSVGPVQKDDRAQLLRDLVAHEFGHFESLMAELSPDALLEFLALQNESLVRDEALRDLMIPTRLACFAGQEDLLSDLANEFASETTTAIANRFCIEYATAVPPAGTLSLTLERYDALMACASEIINKGMLCDSLHYGLSDEEVSLLPSGRLGISRDGAFTIAADSYRAVMAELRMEGTSASFANHWEAPPERVRRPQVLEDLDPAFAEEFGVTIQELADFVGVIANVGIEVSTEPCKLLRTDLVDHLSRELGWGAERVHQVIETFLLRPRQKFLPRDRSYDVYPWRFTRELSYLRRPLLLTVEGGEEWIVWGTRNLARVGTYVISQVMSGRYKANTDAMRSVIGTIRGSEPNLFNDEVYELVSRLLPEAKVDPRVEQIGGKKLQRTNGETIGDVDVLAVDPGSRTVLAIEAKDLSLARNVHEMASESDSLLHDERSTMFHHGERAQWLNDNLEHVVRSSGFEWNAGKWKVKPLVVTSHELMNPEFQSAPIEFAAMRSLPQKLSSSRKSLK